METVSTALVEIFNWFISFSVLIGILCAKAPELYLKVHNLLKDFFT